jgi:HEAT repeat protein
MNELEYPEVIPFEQVLDALLDEDKPFNPRFLYRFSDLDTHEFLALRKIWTGISTFRRKALMEDLEHLFERDSLLSFESICRLALDDSEAEIRFLAIRSLFEYDVEDLILTFLSLMNTDPDAEVRAIAATALGKYVYQGEIDELPKAILNEIEEHLLKVLQGKDTTLVRRRALESLGYSCRKEIPALIEEAFTSTDKSWLASAVAAMGRSCDQRWQVQVLSVLEHLQPAIRFEAARAAGEIEIRDAIDRLIELTEDDDHDVRTAAIWSLSQIGGERARSTIDSLLDEADDPEEIEYLESALDNLIFNENVEFYGLMDFPEDEDDFELDDYYDDIDDEDSEI